MVCGLGDDCHTTTHMRKVGSVGIHQSSRFDSSKLPYRHLIITKLQTQTHFAKAVLPSLVYTVRPMVHPPHSNIPTRGRCLRAYVENDPAMESYKLDSKEEEEEEQEETIHGLGYSRTKLRSTYKDAVSARIPSEPSPISAQPPFPNHPVQIYC